MRARGGSPAPTRREAVSRGIGCSVFALVFGLVALGGDLGTFSTTLHWTLASGWAVLAYRHLTHAAFHTSTRIEGPGGAP